MTARQLRTALRRHELSQRAFAHLLGRLPQTVGFWVAGTVPVPGYVASFLEAFGLLKPDQRVALLRSRGVVDGRRKAAA